MSNSQNILPWNEETKHNYTMLDFRPNAKEQPAKQKTNAGIIPDRPSALTTGAKPRAGLFSATEMAQNIITNVVNYELDGVVFCNEVSPVFVDNLRKTIAPDIRPNILFYTLIP